MDPARVQDLYTSELLQNIYEGLVTFNAENRVAPALAEKFETNPDGRTYTFHLRRGVRFHRPIGREVTAQDVKYSIERSLWPETRSPTAAGYLEGIVGLTAVTSGKRKDLEGVRVVDPSTLTITLDRPRGYFLGALTYPTGWVVCKDAIEKNGGTLDEHAAIGAGPFMLQQYQRGARVILTVNPDYHGGRPPLDRIERPIVVDFERAHVMYENGEVDAFLPSLSDYVADRTNPKLKAGCHLLQQANVLYLVFQQRLQPVYANRLVRLALAQAIDRDEISRIAYKGTSPRADSFLPPGMPGARPDAPQVNYDPDAARKSLAAAGYPGGRGLPQLTLTYLQNDPQWTAAAQIIRDNLKRNLGVTVSLRPYESVAFWHDTSDEEKVPFYITGWIADYLDPQDFLSALLRSGAKMAHTGYRNPRFDALCDQADAETDPARRIPLYQEADRIAMDDVAVLPLVFFRQPLLVRPYVHDWQSNLLTWFLPHTQTHISK